MWAIFAMMADLWIFISVDLICARQTASIESLCRVRTVSLSLCLSQLDSLSRCQATNEKDHCECGQECHTHTHTDAGIGPPRTGINMHAHACGRSQKHWTKTNTADTSQETELWNTVTDCALKNTRSVSKVTFSALIHPPTVISWEILVKPDIWLGWLRFLQGHTCFSLHSSIWLRALWCVYHHLQTTTALIFSPYLKIKDELSLQDAPNLHFKW